MNLNVVDESDSRTLLDYVQKEIDRTKGSIYEGPLVTWYKFLKGHGARLESEL